MLKINLRESNNLRWSLQKEIETIRIESECRLQTADESKQRLMKELDSQRHKLDKLDKEMVCKIHQQLVSEVFESYYSLLTDNIGSYFKFKIISKMGLICTKCFLCEKS